MTEEFSNRLIDESSPYLLQHAHNPVDWYPWGESALKKARSENKMILVSIGYSACHWCHVMERESFENKDVAQLMNDNFINIKIDREERPDLDHIYMDAVQAMTGSGGWPLNVFLTPQAKPFYGGTYFPPVNAFNRSSWTEILTRLKLAWNTGQDEILKQADNLTGHLQKSNEFKFDTGALIAQPGNNFFTIEDAGTIFTAIMKTADKTWGGFGKAPKFPQTFTIQYLLQYHHYTSDAEALAQAVLSMDKMLEGGIYDQVGGGFSRYSTDEQWLAPHFEKMLYDNALLISILCDLFQLTKYKRYSEAIRKTVAFIEREMMNPQGGFYAALDADSEGEEGKYYIWDKKEIDEILGNDSILFCNFFNITDLGNWSHDSVSNKKNILRILKQGQLFAEENDLSLNEFEITINHCLEKVLTARNKRIRPALDDKILLNWNALMITALVKAAAALDELHYRVLAENNFDYLMKNFSRQMNASVLFHCCKNGDSKFPAFLDDYACLIQSCIYLQELTSDPQYLNWAKALTAQVISEFSDEPSGFFFFTGKEQNDVIFRKKEIYDGATPSGNSIMAENLFYLSVVFDNSDWKQRALKITGSMKAVVLNYPGSFGVWASVLLKQVFGLNEISVIGAGYEKIRAVIMGKYLPARVIQCNPVPVKEFPLLANKEAGSETWIYLCKNHTCKAPVKTPEELFLLMNISTDT